jgi:hypothetical protein
VNKIKLSILSALLFLSQLTCNLQGNAPVPDSGIYGTWEWVNTRGYHWCDPPPFLLIKFDSSGILSVYGTDTLLFRGIFTINQHECIHNSFNRCIHVITPPEEGILRYCNLDLFDDVLISGFYDIDNDTLRISTCGMSISWLSSYIRTNPRGQ